MFKPEGLINIMGNDATELPELGDLSHAVHPFEQPRAIHGAIRGSGAKVTCLEAPHGQICRQGIWPNSIQNVSAQYSDLTTIIVLQMTPRSAMVSYP
jgi:hypothetical protein